VAPTDGGALARIVLDAVLAPLQRRRYRAGDARDSTTVSGALAL